MKTKILLLGLVASMLLTTNSCTELDETSYNSIIAEKRRPGLSVGLCIRTLA